MDSITIFEKIFRVIMSCETMEQYTIALNYLNLACKNGYIEQRFRDAIYIGIYIDKFYEIE